MSAYDQVEEAPDERRRFFRIEDEICLIYRQAPCQDCPDPQSLASGELDALSLFSTLSALRQESRGQLLRLQRDQPEVADYLKKVELRFDTLTRILLRREADLLEHPTRKVNLSASGIAFDVEHCLEPDALLELKLILPPELVVVLTFGKVVYCQAREVEEGETFPYRVGVDFFRIRENDRELLIRHIVKREMEQIRSRKQIP